MNDIAAQFVVQAIHNIWEQWACSPPEFCCESYSKRHKGGHDPFRSMQYIFREELLKHLPTDYCWSVILEDNPIPLSYARNYDIGVFHEDARIALLELSLNDTNVRHALHNGELKLLWRHEGRGVTTGNMYMEDCEYSEDEMLVVQNALGAVPIKGLFFANGTPNKVLMKMKKTTWPKNRTQGYTGDTKFWSVFFPEKTGTLQEVFRRLARGGLWCWFYSTCGESPIEYSPTDT